MAARSRSVSGRRIRRARAVTLLHEMQKRDANEGPRHAVHWRGNGIAMCIARD